jgi:hypothetical protein
LACPLPRSAVVLAAALLPCLPALAAVLLLRVAGGGSGAVTHGWHREGGPYCLPLCHMPLLLPSRLLWRLRAVR